MFIVVPEHANGFFVINRNAHLQVLGGAPPSALALSRCLFALIQVLLPADDLKITPHHYQFDVQQTPLL